MKYRKLGNTDLEVPILSFGASSLGSVFRPTSLEESIKVVHYAIESGVNYIDTAPWYGQGKSETVLGKALEGVERSKYILSTKVCRYQPEVDKMFDFSAERTIQSVDESLQRLGLDCIDIIQIHDIEFAPNLDIVINETLPALQKVKESGKARFIGITGYPLENFKTVIDRSQVKIDTVLTYCRYSMNDTALLDYLPYFEEKGIGVVNASALSMGLLSDRGPPKWHPAGPHIREKCAATAAYCREKGVDLSKLANHFCLRESRIPTTLVSTASLENMKKNIAAVDETLSELEEKTMAEVLDKFMKPLNNAHWEGIEVGQYRESLAKLTQ